MRRSLVTAALPPEPAVRRNFRWAALNGALFEFGAAFAETGTMVAAFLTRMAAGPLAVGAAAAIARFGWFFPQLFAAHYARGRGEPGEGPGAREVRRREDIAR
ncbi:MAG: hypothetical protein HY727_09145 [Candidatus Rokubacteria bacterium]|nr:hypothetical protein [Candidatus Rokubacteria bacterium]